MTTMVRIIVFFWLSSKTLYSRTNMSRRERQLQTREVVHLLYVRDSFAGYDSTCLFDGDFIIQGFNILTDVPGRI